MSSHKIENFPETNSVDKDRYFLTVNENGSHAVQNELISLNDSNVQELVKRIFLNNFEFSYLEEIFKNCTEEELKLIHANYEYIIKLVEKYYFSKA